MTPRPPRRFSAAVERIADSAAVAAVLRLAERPEILSLALVAGALPGAARREIEVEGEKAILSLEVVGPEDEPATDPTIDP